MKRWGMAGLVLMGVSATAFFGDRAAFFQAYLPAYLFWLGLVMGSMAVLMLQYLTGGGWGVAIRPFLEPALRTLPAAALFFLPIAIGLGDIYPWVHPHGEHTSLIAQKAPYLNVPFFLFRAVLYFAVWLVWARLLLRWGKDAEGEPGSHTTRLQVLSGGGLVMYGLTMTFASVDWAMSLSPEWFSTIYGLLFMVGQALSALALAAAAASFTRTPRGPAVATEHLHDFGNLLLAFVMLWAYLSLSQFLIIWSANLPEEITWYLARFKGGWQKLGIFLVVFHFVLPFFLLLIRMSKKRAQALGRIAIWVLLAHFADMIWTVKPAFHPGNMTLHWLDFTLWLGLGGLWIAAYKAFFVPLKQPIIVVVPGGHA
jgi:hypothetical protein